MHAQSNPLWLGNMLQMDYSTRKKQVASMTWSKWTQPNRVCSMRPATNTRYTLCTVKSGYIDICHECHVRGGATLLVWHHQSLEGQLYQGLIESGLWSMHPVTVTPDIPSKLLYCTSWTIKYCLACGLVHWLYSPFFRSKTCSSSVLSLPSNILWFMKCSKEV